MRSADDQFSVSGVSVLRHFKKHPESWFSKEDLDRALDVDVPRSLLFQLSAVAKKLRIRKADDGSYQYSLDVRLRPAQVTLDWEALLNEMDFLTYIIFKEVYRRGTASAPELSAKYRKNKRSFLLISKYCWASELSSTRVLELGSGNFRAIHRPEAPSFGAFWRLARVKVRGDGRLREMNRIESGEGIGIRLFGID